MTSRKRGFTLIELMISIVVVAVLGIAVIGAIIFAVRGCSSSEEPIPDQAVNECCPCSSANHGPQ